MLLWLNKYNYDDLSLREQKLCLETSVSSHFCINNPRDLSICNVSPPTASLFLSLSLCISISLLSIHLYLSLSISPLSLFLYLYLYLSQPLFLSPSHTHYLSTSLSLSLTHTHTLSPMNQPTHTAPHLACRPYPSLTPGPPI